MSHDQSQFPHQFAPVNAADLAAAADAFSRLIESGPDEADIQAFLSNHAYFVMLTPVYDHFFVVSQAPLGTEYCADFALYGSCNGPWWTLVEIERPDDRLFTRAGDPSAKLTHATRQARDWRRWIEDNPDYFDANFENHMFMRRPHIVTGVIIGRRRDLSRNNLAHLLQINRENHYDWIMTYDGLLERARRLTKLRDGTILFSRAYSWNEYGKAKMSEGFQRVVQFGRRAAWELDDV